jgi:pilus assembly protein CpaF
MLQAMNTGHDGSLTTLHANSPADVIARLVMMSRYGMDLPVEVIEEQIGSAIDMVIQIDRSADGMRRVTEVCACELCEGKAKLTALVTWSASEQCYLWQTTPSWLEVPKLSPLIDAEEVLRWQSSL